jgi:hypothetical protein
MVDLRGRWKRLIKLGREMEVKIEVLFWRSARWVTVGKLAKGRCGGHHQKG